MKRLFLIALLFVSGASFADGYHLEVDKWCFSVGEKLEFKCESRVHPYKVFIYSDEKGWHKKHIFDNPRSETQWDMSIVRDDGDILILSQYVFFPGARLLYIMKKTGKYYQTEVANASLGNEVSVVHGRAYPTASR